MVNGPSSTVNYNYDIANRLADVSGVAYTYDDNGNLLNDGVNEYVYDSANRLTTVNGSSSTVSYGYNGLGDEIIILTTIDGSWAFEASWIYSGISVTFNRAGKIIMFGDINALMGLDGGASWTWEAPTKDFYRAWDWVDDIPRYGPPQK